jgi:Bacteriophage HK97-gp10, putative tail-component
MSTRVLFTGMSETRAQPQALAKATQYLAMRVARDAARDIKAAYPKGTGNLRDGVIVERGRGGGKSVANAYVRNTAPHAHLFEHGTKARHFVGTDKLGRKYVTGDRGSGKARNVFIPRMVRWRWVFFQSVKEIMARAGITVTGEA